MLANVCVIKHVSNKFKHSEWTEIEQINSYSAFIKKSDLITRLWNTILIGQSQHFMVKDLCVCVFASVCVQYNEHYNVVSVT